MDPSEEKRIIELFRNASEKDRDILLQLALAAEQRAKEASGVVVYLDKWRR